MQAVLRIDELPGDALGAAARFHSVWASQAQEALQGNVGSLVLVLPTAAYDHRDWRLAATRDLARAFAPQRVNMVAAEDEAAIAAALTYLAAAYGVTGQYLPVDGQGAGNPAE